MKTIKELVKDTFLYNFWEVLSSNPADIAKRHYEKRPRVSFYRVADHCGKHFVMKGIIT